MFLKQCIVAEISHRLSLISFSLQGQGGPRERPSPGPNLALNGPEWVMPFGLCNAPATFQRLMDRVLNDLKWTECLVYFDDIVVIGKTFQEHV